MKVSLIADQAIGEDSTRDVDGLGFEIYARTLAAAASDTRGPFTIGVFGEWGTGKTSLMRLIERQLAEKPNIVTVWFNAWRFEQEEHPIVPLIGTIVQGLERHQGFGLAGKKLVRALRAVAYGFSAKTKVKVPGFAEVEASFVAKDMIDRDQKLTPDPLLDRSLYFGAFKSLDEVELKDNVRVVVLIDDLDRCFPDQAIRLLESIKLVLAQPGFIFVLGVARKVLEGYLQHRYENDYGIRDFKGQLYLDKIVQLPFHIPQATGRVAEFCETLLAGQPPELADELRPLLPVVAEAFGGNPRALIRFVNNILIDYSISAQLTGVIPIRFFAVSRCLEHRWPDVFAALTSSDELASEVVDWQPESYAERAGGAGPAAAVAARLLSELELQRLLRADQGTDWLTDPTMRKASVTFLLTQQRISSLDTSEVTVQYDVHLQFDKEDRGGAIKIINALTKAGVKTHYSPMRSTEVPPRAYIRCVGRSAYDGNMSLLDLEVALKQTDVPFILVSMPGSRLDGPPSSLEGGLWLDWRDGITQARLDDLISTLRKHVRTAGR